jgi:hypothetical protein
MGFKFVKSEQSGAFLADVGTNWNLERHCLVNCVFFSLSFSLEELGSSETDKEGDCLLATSRLRLCFRVESSCA